MSSTELDFDRTVGHAGEDQAVSWRRRDVLLYAVGIGAGPNELSYVYEGSPSFRPFPTYPLVLALKGDDDDTNVFAQRISERGKLPGFPSLNPNTIVHGEQSLQILKPIPTVSGQGWKLKKRISAVHDKGKALILESEATLVSPQGEPYAVMVGSTFYRGGGQGTGYSKSLPSPNTKPADRPPKIDSSESTAPDFELKEVVPPAQAALYRLSGDYNPLHIDPSIGQAGGLNGVILHGLCSYAFAARALLRAFDPHDGQPGKESGVQLEYISARFTSPVRLGDVLLTRVWKGSQTAGGGKGGQWCAFEQIVVKPDGSHGPASLRGVAKVNVPASASKANL
ncbi:unnamed protein product [Tilletia controversa]|uniref:MaoC-like domain-containing protein n=1 Tax=Tilletia controversa TaxID=13291 RepID=A0A8X7MW62_9BASI|nr:hypothetical protein A4X06_0g2568 [Tilletia controversa]CAD6923944.1 unnamed protein product [Tilletia controversa]CAD6925617.1 unnamed protein product [Tilletia controversa]